MTTPTIQIFTKPNCPYCTQAKQILKEASLPDTEYDVKAEKRNADASIYFSGVATVPQIFFGNCHINGAEELAMLKEANLLAELAQVTANSELPLEKYSDEELARGAEDLPLRTVIPESDGTRDNDPEQLPILHFYKEFFGFWPNCFYYMHHWPEAYKLFVYCHNASAINEAKQVIGAPMMFATSYTTSNAHGCNYCQIHSAAIGGEHSIGVVKKIQAAREGNAGQDNPFGAFEVALADLAANATKNNVDQKQIDRVYRLVDQAQIVPKDIQANVTSIAMIAAAFGFLNVFNDLTSVEAESQVGISAGRHGVSQNWQPTNLDHDLPEGKFSLKDMVAKYQSIVAEAGGVEPYAKRELGLIPNWIESWPEQTRDCHVYLYSEIMQEAYGTSKALRTHSPISSELKHLMARVSAIAKGHDYLAAVEGYLAHKVNPSDRNLERVTRCYDAAVAIHQPDSTLDSLFSQSEQAALTLAWLSAQMPLTTPRRFVQPVIDLYSPTELVHLMTVCGIASL
ncbi:MAG: glutaredoxin, partial [Cyanobacteria bacterium]|nr:glutaredoxin [Cyanobacteria bacterium GSL.Bin21]